MLIDTENDFLSSELDPSMNVSGEHFMTFEIALSVRFIVNINMRCLTKSSVILEAKPSVKRCTQIK